MSCKERCASCNKPRTNHKYRHPFVSDGGGHVFEMKESFGMQHPRCRRCSFVPSTGALLDAYIEVNGGRKL